MKRLADVAIDSLLFLCYVIASCVTASVLNYIVLFAADKFVELQYLVRIIISAVVYSLSVYGLLAVFAYKSGYREASSNIGESYISYIPVLIIHLLLSLLFRFNGFISGPVKFYHVIVYFGASVTSADQLSTLAPIEYVPAFLIFSAICATVISLSKKIGSNKRLDNRKKLTGSEAQ